MRDMILAKINFLNIEYGSKKTKEDLLYLATQWAKDLQDERKEDVSAALALYRERNTRFPCLAAILETLNEVRTSGVLTCQAIPQSTTGRCGPRGPEKAAAWGKLIQMLINGTDEEKERARAVGRHTQQLLDAGRPISLKDLEA